MRFGRTLLIPVLAAAMLLLTAVTAAAQSTRYGGSTNQDRRISFSFSDDGRTIERLLIGWRADCRRDGFFYDSATRFTTKRVLRRGGGIVTRGLYRDPERRGVRASIVVRFSAARLGTTSRRPRAVKGTWRARVRVRRGGRQVDTCDTGAVRYTAKRRGR